MFWQQATTEITGIDLKLMSRYCIVLKLVLICFLSQIVSSLLCTTVEPGATKNYLLVRKPKLPVEVKRDEAKRGDARRDGVP